MSRADNVLVGPAGWSYEDWNGPVYPRPRPKGFDPLSFLADAFDAIEINTTFYHPGSKKNALSWASRVSNNPRFQFTVKIWSRLTHEKTAFTGEDAAAAGIVPHALAEKGILGAALIQFPWSFKNEPGNVEKISRLARELSGLPLAVEVRHGSWNSKEFFDFLRDMNISFVNLDQPLIGDSMPPLQVATGGIGYVRLHGRNKENWFKKGAGRDDRYHYRYGEDELRPWVERSLALSASSETVFVIANNHYKGHAVTNALEIKRALGQKAELPLLPGYGLPLFPD